MPRLLLAVVVLLVAHSLNGQVVFSGHLYAASDRKPIANAVLAFSGVGLHAISDERGYFEITIPEGAYLLQVSHLAYIDYRDSLILSKPEHRDFILTPRQVELGAAQILTERSLQRRASMAPVVMLPGPERFSSGVNLHLGAMLRELPGVSSVNTGVSAGQPWIRGLGSQRVGVFVDGVPQQNQQWGVDHGSDLDPWMAERIEVYKGPATLAFGSNASAGAVVVKPISMPDPGGLRAGAFSRFQSVNGAWEGGLNVRKSWERWQLSVSAIERSFADYRVPAERFTYIGRVLPIKDERLVNTSGESSSQYAALRYGDEQASWLLSVRRSHATSGLFPGIFGLPSVQALEGDGDPRQTQLPQTVSDHTLASLSHERKGELLDFDLTVGWQNSRRFERGEPHTHSNRPMPIGTTALDLQLQTLYVQTSMEREWSGGRRLFAGLQAEHKENRSAGWEYLVNDYSSSTAGLFAGLDGLLNVAGGKLDAGARFDLAQVWNEAFDDPIYDENQNVVGWRTLSAQNDKSFSGFSLSFAWQKELNEHQNLHLQLARGTRFPEAYELSANGVHHGTFRHEQGNADLQTEHSWQIDAKWVFQKGRSKLEFTPFAGYFENFIYLAPSGRFSLLPHAGQVYSFQANEVLRAGAELMIHTRLNDAIEWRASGEYLLARNLDEGTSLPWTPPLSVVNHLRWNWMRRRGQTAFLKLGHRFFAAQYEVDRNERPTDAYQLFDLTVGWDGRGPKGHSWRFNVFANNLLNAVYTDHLSRYKLIGLPEAGRNLGFVLIYEFNNP